MVDDEIVGLASVPSGASTGSREALELRDEDMTRYGGKGVQKAVRHVNEILGPAVEGLDPTDQRLIDQVLASRAGWHPQQTQPGGQCRARSGMAVARSAAGLVGLPLYRYLGGASARILPTPMLNVLNGGAHADNNVDIQEFMILPVGLESFTEAIRCSCEVYHALKKVVKGRGLSTGIGDEGGFAPNLKSNREALDLIMEGIEKAGFRPGEDVALALDVAAPEFYKDGGYHLEAEWRVLDAEKLTAFYTELGGGLPDCFHRGRNGRGIGTAGRCSPMRWDSGSSSSATICS